MKSVGKGEEKSKHFEEYINEQDDLTEPVLKCYDKHLKLTQEKIDEVDNKLEEDEDAAKQHRDMWIATLSKIGDDWLAAEQEYLRGKAKSNLARYTRSKEFLEEGRQKIVGDADRAILPVQAFVKVAKNRLMLTEMAVKKDTDAAAFKKQEDVHIEMMSAYREAKSSKNVDILKEKIILRKDQMNIGWTGMGKRLKCRLSIARLSSNSHLILFILMMHAIDLTNITSILWYGLYS